MLDDPLRRFLTPTGSYHLTRFAVVRLVGFIYLVAFVSLYRQLDPLLSQRGLLPVASFLEHAHAYLRAHGQGHGRLPTLFWLGASDGALHVACALGIVLSLAVCAGVTNALVQLALWAIY